MSDTNDPEGQPPDQGQQPDYGQPPGYGQQPDDGQPAFGQPPDQGQQPDYGPGYGEPPGYGQTTAFGAPGPHWLPAPPGYGGVPGQIADETSPILVSFAGPAKQRRVTILFRFILAIPHLVLLWALAIVSELMAFIGWFAALFTGKLPDWAHTFITQVIRWETRVFAYLWLLTDSYPPFSLDDLEYPVRLVTRRTKLNRLAVFFRFILVIPAAIVAAVSFYGLTVLGFFVWLIALISGGLPPALHQAVAALVRYQARYTGYLLMTTSEYPKRLYGDNPPMPSIPYVALATTAPGPDSGPDITTAAPEAESVIPRSAEGQQGAASEPNEMTTDAGWRLQLSSEAKAMVTVFVVLGALAYGGSVIVDAVTSSNTINNAVALGQVEQADRVLNKSSQGFQSAVQACGNDLSCATGQLAKEAGRLQTFDSQINAIGLTGQAATDAATLVSADQAVERDFNQLAAATSASQYVSILHGMNLQQDLSKTGAAYSKVISDLSGTRA